MPATMVMVALSLLVLLQLQEFLPASGGHLPQSQCTVVFPADHGRKLADGSKDYRTPTQNLRRRALQQDKEDEADANPDHETARGSILTDSPLDFQNGVENAPRGKGGEDTQLPLKDEDEEDDEEGVDVDVDVDEDEDEDEGSRQQVTVLHAQDQQRHQQLNQEVREAQGPQPRRHLDSRETHNLIVNPTRMQQQPQQQGSSQLTVLMLSTFEDIRRALSSLSTIKMHLAPELVREGILLTPWREFLALRNAISSTMGGRVCDPGCFTGSSKAAEALKTNGLLPPNSIASTARIATSSDPANLDCNDCGPPLWVVPEHLALGIEREEMANMEIYGYRLQMVLKLTASVLVSTSHYLVLDSDVLMIRRVGPQQAHWLFPEPGRALYQPQRRHIHRHWWSSTEAVLGLAGCLSTHSDTRVFGVTPAILATDIAATAARYWDMHIGGGSRVRMLRDMLPMRRPFFTEYCSYHLVAECHMGKGTIDKYHALPPEVKEVGMPASASASTAPVLYRGLWKTGAWNKPGGRIEPCADCIFLVVQSTSRVKDSKVVGDLEKLFLWG